MTHRRTKVVATALLALLLAACAGIPERRFFTLSVQEPAPRAEPGALHPVQLWVKRFEVGLAFNRAQIVYRQSPYQFSFYSYRLWADKPQRMLRSLVVSHLEAIGLVQRVIENYGEQAPDYNLAAEVVAIEEFDSGDVWYGHLAMRFELVRVSDGEVIWTYRFDRRRRVPSSELVLVVRAISRIAEEELARIGAELDQVLSAERGVAATLPIPPPTTDEMPLPGKDAPDPTPAPTPAGPPRHKDRSPPEEDELITPDGTVKTPARAGDHP